ncbi:MAG: tetratricopeptide repeat protein [Alphaproteobacteria bacterium]|nr:tetratricopeptide repeat protein [Alphaproteobacteria bacterium]
MNQPAASTRKLMKMAQSALQKKRGQDAIDLLQQVLAMNPYHADALHQIGFILHGAGNYAGAADFYQRAIQADPGHVESYLLLSRAFEAQDYGTQAVQVAARACEIAPANPATHAALVKALLRFNGAHEVPRYLERHLPNFPDSMELHAYDCFALRVNNRHAEADVGYRALMARFRVPVPFQVMYETYLPRLYLSTAQIDSVREAFGQSIDNFMQKKLRFDALQITNHPLFALAYHHRDNRELLQRYTQMLRVCAPELNYTAAHCKVAPLHTGGKIRVGFVSRHMHDHSVGRCYRNLMLALARHPGFAVTLFNVAGIVDATLDGLGAAGIPMISLPGTLAAAQGAIAREKPDILIYPDIGMDAMTHYLAMARLAPHQCCLQGHPETTGIDTIDYVISARAYEPPQANRNYGEQLLCHPGIDTVFSRPQAPERWLTREELGLPADRNLYICPMAIQKIHPDFDSALAGILAHDSKATLLLFHDFQQQTASDILKQRILKHCDPARVIFLNWQPLDVLFSILHTADAILDTFYFGAGTTSQYAFGFGLPIVTMPGDYARGRMVYGYYSVMGIADAPVAENPEDYIACAVKLANDTAYRNRLSAELLQKNAVLFEGSPTTPDLAPLLHAILNRQTDAYRI